MIAFLTILFLIKKLGGTLIRLARASGSQRRQVPIYFFIGRELEGK